MILTKVDFLRIYVNMIQSIYVNIWTRQWKALYISFDLSILRSESQIY